jgi:hypothetical protein
LEVLVAENTFDEGEGVVVRRGQLIAVVWVLLIGCAVLLLMAGASGVRAQENTEATNNAHLNPCERIRKKLEENRPLSREERRIHATGFCDQGADVMLTVSASASPTPVPLGGTGGPAILLPAALLLLGSGILTYVILRRR